MNRNILFIALMADVLSAMCQRVAFGDVSANEQDADVLLTITKFQVNDQTLELSYKMKNVSDHDVWILESVDGLNLGFEVYIDEDDQTLLIRRRLNVPSIVVWFIVPTGTYLRLNPGEEWVETLSLTLPVQQDWAFSFPGSKAKYAKRLTLEIGFYDEDLPSTIRTILEFAEKLDWEEKFDIIVEGHTQIRESFFKGLYIALDYGGLSGFNNNYNTDSNRVPINYSEQCMTYERTLSATVDGVSIPCGDVSATDEPPQSETEFAGITTVLTKFDVNDTNLKMDFKIINNTDHDIWLCDNYVDKFMETDNRTLVLRTRYNLSKDGILWEFPFPRFRYSRLGPGQEKVESYSLSLPVKPHALFETSRGNAEYAKQLAVEIGYYLTGLILDVVEISEKLNCDGSALPPTDLLKFSSTDRLYHRFFGGVEIAIFFNSESFTYFRDSVTSGGDEIIAPYLFQTLNGEKVLRIEVDNVSIPYASRYPPLND
jgi:hypothetical protein